MAVRPVRLWPDPVLSRVADPVTDLSAARELAADMLDTMYDAQGRGLAAPQMGVPLRLFVMDAAWKQAAPTPRVFVNPVVLWRSDAVAEGPEGCLSIPGITTKVARSMSIRLRWSDLDDAAHEADLTGFDAICAQHEIDHLDGIVTLDRLSPEDRAKALSEYRP